MSESYEQAIREWAYAIANMPALCGMLMGRASALREQLGVTMPQMAADLRGAQQELEA